MESLKLIATLASVTSPGISDAVWLAITNGVVTMVLLVISRLMSRNEHLKTANTLERVEKDVNSSKTADTAKIDTLTKSVLTLTGEIAELKENARGKATAATLKADQDAASTVVSAHNKGIAEGLAARDTTLQ